MNDKLKGLKITDDVEEQAQRWRKAQRDFSL